MKLRAQATLEYMLLLSLVAVVVFLAFNAEDGNDKNFLEQTQQSIQSYFDEGADKIRE